MSSTTLAEQIKSSRTKLGWSQQKLAEVAKLSIDTVRSVETGRNINPTLYVIKQLERSLIAKFEL